jgi:hypothetical protein
MVAVAAVSALTAMPEARASLFIAYPSCGTGRPGREVLRSPPCHR